MYYYMSVSNSEEHGAWTQIPVRSIEKLKTNDKIIVCKDEFLKIFKCVTILDANSFQNRENDMHCWMNLGSFDVKIDIQEYSKKHEVVTTS